MTYPTVTIDAEDAVELAELCELLFDLCNHDDRKSSYRDRHLDRALCDFTGGLGTSWLREDVLVLCRKMSSLVYGEARR